MSTTKTMRVKQRVDYILRFPDLRPAEISQLLDNSIYAGDFELYREVHPGINASTVIDLKTTDVSPYTLRCALENLSELSSDEIYVGLISGKIPGTSRSQSYLKSGRVKNVEQLKKMIEGKVDVDWLANDKECNRRLTIDQIWEFHSAGVQPHSYSSLYRWNSNNAAQRAISVADRGLPAGMCIQLWAINPNLSIDHLAEFHRGSHKLDRYKLFRELFPRSSFDEFLDSEYRTAQLSFLKELRAVGIKPNKAQLVSLQKTWYSPSLIAFFFELREMTIAKFLKLANASHMNIEEMILLIHANRIESYTELKRVVLQRHGLS